MRFKWLILLFIMFVVKAGVEAQVAAGFDVIAPASNCNPAVYNFVNTSTGTGLTYRWNFGTHAGVNSIFINPSTTYLNCGSYQVHLVATDVNGVSDSITKTVTIHCSPQASFTTTNTLGCLPLASTFNSTSANGGAAIINYTWDFGDGNGDTMANPNHTYVEGGCKNVTLVITNAYGCSNDTTINHAVCVYAPPVSAFTSNAQTSCHAPFNVSYHANSSGGTAPYIYHWIFQGGAPATSTALNPAVVYNNPGSFTTTLITTDAHGCSDTSIRTGFIFVPNDVANFTIDTNPHCAPAKVYLTADSNIYTSSWAWSVNSPGSMSQNGLYKNTMTFTQSGNYNICLTINYTSGCTAHKCTNIYVSSPPIANFGVSGNLSTCLLNNPINFTDSSLGANLSYNWSFPGGTPATSTLAAPPTIVYQHCGSFSAGLTVTNGSGCVSNAFMPNYLNIACNVASFSVSPSSGCLPLTANFNSGASTGNPVSWLWDFGDPGSGTDTSTLQNPSHIYDAPGCHTVRLITTTAEGCVYVDSIVGAVCGGFKPHANFSGNPPMDCAGKPIHFLDSSTNEYSYTQHYWNFHSPVPFTTESTDSNPTYTYGQAGIWDITLIVSNFDCADTITKDSYVTTVVPVSSPKLQTICGQPLSVTLDGTASQGAQSYKWILVGGSPDSSTSPIVTATYPGPGTYSASLYVQNDSTGCSDLQAVQVHITGPEAEFTASPRVGCSPMQACFSSSSNLATFFQWRITDDFQTFDTTFLSPSPCLEFLKPGRYNVQLIAGDTTGCLDTVFKPHYISISHPIADFSAVPLMGCAPLAVNFTDASNFQGSNASILVWSFGDVLSGITNNHSNLKNPQHVFNNPGSYSVLLSVIDSNGCANAIIKNNYIIVSKPQVSFTDTATSNCNGVTACFTSTTPNSGIHYQWLFGDSSTSSLANPCHLYSTSGSYNASVIVTDAAGCTDTVTQVQHVQVVIPQPAFVADTTTATCPPLAVTFTNLTTGYSPDVTWKWRFGDGQVSTLRNPFHIYASPGVFSVTLIASVPNGCVDSIVYTDYINISGPIATLAAPPTGGCVPHQDCLRAFSTNTVSYTWDFGDGSVIPGEDSICYTYNRTGNFYAQLILDNGLGCIFALPVGDVSIYGMIASFSAVTPAICGPGNIQFNDSSYGTSAVQTFVWNFGDPASGTLNTSNVANPAHFYTTAGHYRVREIIYTTDGCVDTAYRTVVIKPLPVLHVQSHNPGNCNRDSVTVSEQTTDPSAIASISWNFGDPLSGIANTSTRTTAAHFYTAPGTYNISLAVSDVNGCNADSVLTITVHQKPLVDFTSTNVCINAQPFNFTNSSTNGNLYNWSFGDGNQSTVLNPAHTYQDTGIYTVRLVVKNNYCSDTLSKPVQVYSLPVAAFSLASTSVCGVPAIVLVSNHSVNSTNYSWNFGNNTYASSINPLAEFTNAGVYNILLTAVSNHGCVDTISHSLVVHNVPAPEFTATSVCMNHQPVNFNNQTQSGSNFTWLFGDGSSSSLSNPEHSYQDTGSYFVRLVSQTAYCSDTLTRQVQIYSLPEAAFSLHDTTQCGPHAQFAVINQSKNASLYSWNFGNGTYSNNVSPVADYNASGNYSVQLVATNSHGCMDTFSRRLTVYPKPSATIDIRTASGCVPLTIQLQANATNANNYTWNFGAGGALVNGESNHAGYTYTDTGSYNIALYLTSANGCADTVMMNSAIQVHPLPSAAFDTVINTSGYPYDGIVSFVNRSKGAETYTWNFGDGSLSYDVNPTHTFEHIDTFSAQLIAATEFGCADTAYQSLYVIHKALYVPNALQPDFQGDQNLVKIWKPLGTGLLNYHAQVFDKWGALIWESEKLSDWQPVDGWDGTYMGKPCQQDVYVWKINAVFLDGSIWPGMSYDKNEGGGTKTIGSITLIR